MDEPIEAEIQPTNWTPSSSLGSSLMVAAVVVPAVELLFGDLPGSWTGYLPFLALFVTGLIIEVAARRSHHDRPASTEAWFEEDGLVIRDPYPFWKRVTAPLQGKDLRLEIDSVERGEGGLVVTGRVSRWWTGLLLPRRFRVRLRPEEERIEALEARLAEMVQE